MQTTVRRESTWIALLCGAGILAMSWLPLQGAMPGNCDTWLSMAVSRGWLQHFGSLLESGVSYSAMYPGPPAVYFGESAPAAALVFLLLDAFLPLPWAVAWLVGIFLGLSAYGVSLFSRTCGLSAGVSLFAGVAFATSNFVFANIDDSVMLFWLLPLLALREVQCGLAEPNVGETHSARGNWPLRVGILLGLQLYFSVYVFLYGCVAVGTFLVFRGFLRRHELAQPIKLKQILSGVLAFAAFIVPWFWFYLSVRASLDFLNPFNAQGVTRMCTLSLTDLVATLPGNRLWPTEPPEWHLYWSEVRKHAFLGTAPLLLTLPGLARRNAVRAPALILIFSGLVLGVSPTLTSDPWEMYPLVAILQQFVSLAEFVRVPLRSFFLTGIGVSLLAANGLQGLLEKLRPNRGPLAGLLVSALIVFHLYENVPATADEFKIGEFTQTPDALLDLAEEEPDAIVLHLPSRLGLEFLDSHQPVFGYSRELIYFLWQGEHGLRTVNGANGYTSPRRVEVDALVKEGVDPEALRRLTRDFGVTHISFHRDLLLDPVEHGVIEGIAHCLEPRTDGRGATEIYNVIDEACSNQREEP